MLVKIGDLADDDGRNCFAEPEYLARKCRMSLRGAQYLLHRLERQREIDIEWNDHGREIVLRGGRHFRPKWFLHVRCVFAWDAYQHEDGEVAKSSNSGGFKRGRPRRKFAKVAHSDAPINRKDCAAKSQVRVDQFASTRTAYKEGSVRDPLVRDQAGAARRQRAEKNSAEWNLRIVAKQAHEVLDLFAATADLTYRDITEAIERRCEVLGIPWRSTDDISRALDSAVYQRKRVGKPIPACLRGSAGDAAFRLKEQQR